MFSLFHVYWGQRQSYVLWACIQSEPAVAVGTLFYFLLGALVIQQILGNIHVAGTAPPRRRRTVTPRARAAPYASPAPPPRRAAEAPPRAPPPQCSSASTPRPATAFSAARPPPTERPPSPWP